MEQTLNSILNKSGIYFSRFSIKFMYIKILKSTVIGSVCYAESGLHPKARGKLKDNIITTFIETPISG